MNNMHGYTKQLAMVTLIVLGLGACASAPMRSSGADNARVKLNQLSSDYELASRVPTELQQAESAVRAAEQPQRDRELARHLAIMADKRVDLAVALAQGRLMEDQRAALTAEGDQARLDARTMEAERARRNAEYARAGRDAAMDRAAAAATDRDAARDQAHYARTDRDAARDQADYARADRDVAYGQAASARADAYAAEQLSSELRRQIDELNARETDRGYVMTLGDVMFETDRAELRGGVPANLAQLAEFLQRYPDRSVSIEGHTDSVGSAEYNEGLSRRRAESVQSFLMQRGVASNRMRTSGMGQSSPVASNDSATGRQQNRRVEVIISRPTS